MADPLNRVATAIGAGLLAGAAGKVLGVQPRNPAGRARFSNVVHWTYGTTSGAARGLIGLAGLNEAPATAVHFTAVWGWSLVMLPAFE